MNDQQKRVIPYSDFDMVSVKYSPKTGLDVVYFNKATGRRENPSDDKHKPHPDLLEALKALAPHVAHILGLQDGWDYARENLKDNSDLLRGAMSGANEADGRFTVSGIRFAGSGKNASVKITGSLKCKTGAVGMASPLINFQSNAMAIEQTIQALCEKVKEEVFNFVITGKEDAKQEEIDFNSANDPDIDQPIKNKGGRTKKQLRVDEEAEKATEE
jgi:hypothetical protein